MIEVTLKGKEAEEYLTVRPKVIALVKEINAAIVALEKTTPSSLRLPSEHWGQRGKLKELAREIGGMFDAL